MLPRDLQWPEDDPTSFPAPQPANLTGFGRQLDPNLSRSSGQQTNLPLFTSDLDSEPVHYPYVYDVQVALLRTRFYYAKYIVYRPLVYKALHFPDQMTQEDAEGAAECLRVCPKNQHFRGHKMLTIDIDMFELATHIISSLTQKKTSTVSILLVPEFPGRPHHPSYDST
jgi:hypothetical protein